MTIRECKGSQPQTFTHAEINAGSRTKLAHTQPSLISFVPNARTGSYGNHGQKQLIRDQNPGRPRESCFT